MQLAKEFKEHTVAFFIGTVLLGGWLYAVIGTFTRGYVVDNLRDDLNSTKAELTQVKQSLIGVVVTDPKQAKIVGSLVSDASFHKGLNNFAAGNYQEAFAAWKLSAENGTSESITAITAAKATLQQRIADPQTSPESRQVMQAALGSAPSAEELNVEYQDLMYRKEPKR